MMIEPYDFGEKIYPEETGEIIVRTRNQDYYTLPIFLQFHEDEPWKMTGTFVEENGWYVAEFFEVPPGNHILLYPNNKGSGPLLKRDVTVYKGRKTRVDIP